MAIQKNNLNPLAAVRKEADLSRRELALLATPKNALRQDINDAMQEILQIETGSRSRCRPRLERALKALRVNVPALERDLAAWAAVRQRNGCNERDDDLDPTQIFGFQVATLGHPGCNFILGEVGWNGKQGGDSGHGGRLLLKFTSSGGDLMVGVDGQPPQPVDSVEIWVGGDIEAENIREILSCGTVALRAWEAGRKP
jgi:hypothetical protein